MSQEKKNYKIWYDRITATFRENKKALCFVRRLNSVCTALMYAAYAGLLLVLAYDGWQLRGFWGMIAACMPYVLIPGTGFVLLTVIRDRIDRKRPYEEWDIQPLIYKETKGHSMPSRHIFSAALISMCVLSRNGPAGMALLLITVLLSWIRVVGGVHYPKDVAVGFGTGVLVGTLLFVLVRLHIFV